MYADSDAEVIKKLQAGNYDRIYLSEPKDRIGRPEVMKWLHANYDLGDIPEDYKLQIFDRRK